MNPSPDPYHALGLPREATAGEIKAAHRRLAKRFHPDAVGGDTERFLAVQDAYQVLSDPLARRDWDARHRPGPVRADSAAGGRGRPSRAAPRGRGAGGRGDASADAASTDAGAAEQAASGSAGAAAGSRPRPGQARRRRPRPDPFSTSGRDQTADSYTWSAQDVPWWSSGPARNRAAEQAGRPPAAEPPPPQAQTPQAPTPTATGTAPTADFDVYNRSSGAAWSMASRAYFRKAGADLPRGAAEPFGQRWTTPPGKPSTGPGPSPAARPSPPPASPHPRPAQPAASPPSVARATASVRPAPATAAAATPGATGTARPGAPRRTTWPAAGTSSGEGIISGSAAVADLRRRLASSRAWPSPGGRALYAGLAWVAPAIGLIAGPLSLPAPWAVGVLAGLLVAFALVPEVAYLAAAGGTAALVVVAGLVLGEAAYGAYVPAPFDLFAAAGVIVVYVGAAALAAFDWPLPRPWRDVV